MNKPYVTICVVSYNSSPYVVETLESIKRQSYDNIELIVSDDGSTDGTDEICEKWIQKNKKFFKNVQLIVAKKNTGVTGNCNRGLEASNGEWWKVIAADDILKDDCIEKFVDYINANPEAEFVFGKEIEFTGEFSNQNFTEKKLRFSSLFFRPSMTAKKQYEFETKVFVGSAIGSFGKTEVLKKVGGFNPRFPMHEDSPLYIQLPKCGIRMWYMDEFVAYRRVHRDSISRDREDYAILSKHEIREMDFWKYKSENSRGFWKKAAQKSAIRLQKVIDAGNDKRSLKCRYLDWCRRWISPYKWYLIIVIIEDKILQLIYRKK